MSAATHRKSIVKCLKLLLIGGSLAGCSDAGAEEHGTPSGGAGADGGGTTDGTSGGSSFGGGTSGGLATGGAAAGSSAAGSSAAGSSGSGGELGHVDTLPLPEPGTAGVAYLSELTEAAGAINGWGPVEKDMTNGWTELGDGATPIDLFDGATYSKGIGCHSWAKITYDLGGKYRLFVADIGYTFNETPGGTVVFQVVLDGETAFDSGTFTAESERAQTVNVDVAGKNTMDLVVTDAGDGIYADHVAWAGARLME